jgi:hypothetical protein
MFSGLGLVNLPATGAANAPNHKLNIFNGLLFDFPRRSPGAARSLR